MIPFNVGKTTKNTTRKPTIHFTRTGRSMKVNCCHYFQDCETSEQPCKRKEVESSLALNSSTKLY